MRDVLTGLAITIGVAVLLGVVRLGDRKAIARAEAEAAQLAGQRDSLLGVVTGLEAARDTLTRERASDEGTIADLRDSVATLERVRADGQLDVRRIQTTGALLDRFRAAFPTLADSTVGLTTVPLPGDSLGLEYLMVPAFFAETFLIDHQNAAAWRAQRDGLLVVDSLRAHVAALQDSITQLALTERNAVRRAYDSAYGAYQALNTRYLAELRKPRVQIGSVLGVLLGAGAGFLAAELIR